MRKLLVDIAHTLVPPKGDRHGPLPPLMLTLTLVTGLVDAVSFLGLGQVFVANMTGNVALLGFALAGAGGLSAPATLVSLASFLAGAVVGGRIGFRFGAHRGRLLASALALQAALVGAALVTALAAHDSVGTAGRYTLIVALGLAMGTQTAVARRLGVPDLTTTVLTQTLTGLASDSAPAGGDDPRPGRRILSALALVVGALVGALLLDTGLSVVLGVVLALLLAAAAVTRRLAAGDAAWVRP
ncbi:YoaK family protein [Streptomyces sp. NBC_00691]|uniref:YoaK family protein n=1 Tax=Streptomyces sp. NBC_00691 TaxID=2903671 RepID=UPI002E3509B0|nr:YoaK family protein [Streptomyces sp. NBC_00691]